ncbi:unnamed protein product, partial [Medioppia subpectinata]
PSLPNINSGLAMIIMPPNVAITRTLNIVLAFVWDVWLLGEESDWTSVTGALVVTVCIAGLGVSKWRQEKPDQFTRCTRKVFCCCCCYGNHVDTYADDSERDVLIIRKHSQPFYDSIDDKPTGSPVIPTRTPPRNESFTGKALHNDDIVVEKNRILFP